MTGSVKKSQFLAYGNNAIPNEATIDFVYNGVNYKQTYANFISNLGVTGSIVQIGDPLCAPVLDKSGAINGIRNIKGGFGVDASISADDCVEISVNYSFDETGVTIVDDPAAETPVFRSIIPGSGINVSGSAGQVQISLSATPASTKTVVVNQLSDFPSAVLGVITLASDTEYAIRNDISTSDRFVLGNNTVITGSDEEVVNLTYTGVGNMFTGSSVTSKLKNIKITCSSGTFLNFVGSGTEIFQLVDSTVIASTLGTIGGLNGVQLTSVQFNVTTNGFLLTGSNGVMLTTSMLATIAAGTLFDLGTSTFNGISFTDCFSTLNGSSVFLSGAASSANLNTGALGSVHNCRFFGAGTPLSTITVFDLQWQFFINDAIPETHKDALMSMTGNTTATVITVAGTPVLIAGTWVQEHVSQFSTTAAGRITYNGIKDTHFDVTMSFSAEPVSGTNKVIGFYIYLNGTKITASEANATISAGGAKRVTVVWRVSMSTGDYVEAYVENETDTVDVLVSDAVMRVS